MGRVWINAAQYFEGVTPEAWEFRLGGDQVCEKWLKDHNMPVAEVDAETRG